MEQRLQPNKMKISSDNRGFSLMELLVSIVILILIMIPLMNNFFRSVKINQEAAVLQDYSNIAANLVEDMKSQDLEQTLTQYQSNRLIKNADGSFGTYDSTSSTSEDTYYFGFNNLLEGDHNYDALVTIDAKEYQKKLYDSTKPNDTYMNNYKIPDIVTVDSNRNGMFFSNMYKNTENNVYCKEDDPLSTTVKSLEELVQQYFQAVGNSYADQKFKANSTIYANFLQKLRAYQNGETTVVPVEPSRSSDTFYANLDYCKTDYITDRTYKTSELLIDKTEVSTGVYHTVITYQITYYCNWDAELGISDNEITFVIETKNYGTLINNVYLYYESSIFQNNDIYHPEIKDAHPDIKISNNSGKSINFFIVKQQDHSLLTSINIKQSGANPINLYTNIPDKVDIIGVDNEMDVINKDIIASEVKNRIYKVQVQIFEHTDSTAKYQGEELYLLDTSRDE